MVPLLALAAAAAQLGPVCPDRPAKGTSPCTVDDGHFQVEVDLVDWSRTTGDGSSETDWLVASPTIKYGVGSSTDLEVSFTPYERTVVHDSTGRTAADGFGDTILKVKQRLTPSDAKISVSLVPYVKLPTAGSTLGNGKVEEGLIAPVSFSLPHNWSIGFTPEVDRLANGDGGGFHGAGSASLALNVPVAPKLTGTLEGWVQRDWDPAGTVRRASADLGLAYLASNDTQLDGGANLGLTRATADVQLYVGISHRF